MTTAEPGQGRDDVTDSSTFAVLLATDGRPAAAAAEQLVRRLGDPRRVVVTALGVSSFELAAREGERLEGHFSPEAAQRYTREAVNAAADRLAAAGFETDTHVEHDDPALRILETAHARGSELIVLGGRPRGLPGPAAVLDRFRDDPAYAPPSEADADDTATALDSVSTSVLRRADASVMIVHGEPMDRPDDARMQVVVGADGSPASMAAIRALGGFADPTDVEVHVVSVVEPSPNLTVARSPSGQPMVAVGSRMAEVDEETAQEVVELSHADAKDAATQATELLRALGFAVEVDVIESGAVADALLDQVRARSAALTVVGSRGLGTVRRALLGSVSNTLVHAAPATLVAEAPD